MTTRIVPVTAQMWPAFEDLFGKQGACYGCWCMHFRLSPSERKRNDRDGNKDGEVSWGEWIASKISPISIEGMAVTEVAMSARYMPEVIMRDGSFAQEAARMYLNFAVGLVQVGIYAAYFSRGVKAGEEVVTTGSFLLKTETSKESIGAGCCEAD